MRAWAPAVTEADLGATLGAAGNRGRAGFVPGLGVTAGGGQGRGSGCQEGGWAGMKEGGRREDGKEEEGEKGKGEGGREEGATPRSSWHAQHLPPTQAFKFPTSDLSQLQGRAPGASLPKTLPRRARIVEAQPCFLGEHLRRHS